MRFQNLLAALLLALPGAAHAQQQGLSETTREAYTFLGTRLVIDVLTEAPGTLRLLRGDGGEVRVTARAKDGFAGMSMSPGDREHLSLTSLGAQRVEFLVVVPSYARVDVRMPKHDLAESFGTLQKIATFKWGEDPKPAPAVATDPPSIPAPASPINVVTAYSSISVPHMLSVVRPEDFRTTTVRLEGDHFELSTDLPLDIAPAGTGVLEVRPTGAGENLVVKIPAATTDFVLQVGGRAALIARNGTWKPLCASVTEQRLPDGRRWWTFAPAHSEDCSTPHR
jgi:hypothetical protein